MKKTVEESFKTLFHGSQAHIRALEQQLKEANKVINKGLNAIRFELGEIEENEHTAYDWVIKCVVPYNDKYKTKE